MSYRRKTSQQYSIRRLNVPRLEAKVYSNKWDVRSHSDPSKFYTVSLTEDGQYECSCPQWIYRRRECKHIQQVKNSPIGAVTVTKTAAVFTYPPTIGKPKKICPECGERKKIVRDPDTEEVICANCGLIITKGKSGTQLRL